MLSRDPELSFFEISLNVGELRLILLCRIALTKLGWRYYVVYDVWIAFELVVVYFLFIETKSNSLEEIFTKD